MLLRAKTGSDVYLLPTSSGQNSAREDEKHGLPGHSQSIVSSICLPGFLRWVANILGGRGNMVSMSIVPGQEVIVFS